MASYQPWVVHSVKISFYIFSFFYHKSQSAVCCTLHVLHLCYDYVCRNRFYFYSFLPLCHSNTTAEFFNYVLRPHSYQISFSSLSKLIRNYKSKEQMQKYNKNKKIKYIRRNESNVRVLHRRCDGQQQRQTKLILIVA